MDDHKKKGKRKGLGITPEMKKHLKLIIMRKAAEEMKAEQKKRAQEKDDYLKKKVDELNIAGLDQSALKSKVKQLHDKVSQLEEEKYDWEVRIRRQDYEINQLNIKVNDVKGKFIKPVLKKVNKTENKLKRFEKKKDTKNLAGFREGLKSTGQNKYALDEKDEKDDKVDWGKNLKQHAKEPGHTGEVVEGGEDQEAAATIMLDD